MRLDIISHPFPYPLAQQPSEQKMPGKTFATGGFHE